LTILYKTLAKILMLDTWSSFKYYL